MAHHQNAVRLLSTARRGLAYELLVVRVLRRYSFQLMHVGRSGDQGQDFLGHWVLPGNRRVPVVGRFQESRLSPLNMLHAPHMNQRVTHSVYLQVCCGIWHTPPWYYGLQK